MTQTDDDRAAPAPRDSAGAGAPAASDGARREAGERWIREHGDVLWRFALARTGDPHAAEEVVQDTLLAALERLHQFSGRSAERTWLLGIASNKAADYFRRARRRKEQPLIAEQESDADSPAPGFTRSGRWAETPGAWPPAGGDADLEFELQALRQCLETLPAGQREAVWLRDLMGLSSEEICEALRLTATNLWTRLHRARSALRVCVQQKLRNR